MDIHSKISQLIHIGEFKAVKAMLNNIHHSNKDSLHVQCLHSSVAVQNYEMVDYFIKKVPSHKDTAQVFKIAIRGHDHKMVDILLKNKPNTMVCSEAVLEAIEYNDTMTIKKMLLLSDFTSRPANYMQYAILHGSHQSLLYLFQTQTPSDEIMEILLTDALHPGYHDQKMLQILDETMSYSSTQQLQKTVKKYSPHSTNPNVQRLREYCAIRTQHEAIAAAVEVCERPTSVRKM